METLYQENNAIQILAIADNKMQVKMYPEKRNKQISSLENNVLKLTRGFSSSPGETLQTIQWLLEICPQEEQFSRQVNITKTSGRRNNLTRLSGW